MHKVFHFLNQFNCPGWLDGAGNAQNVNPLLSGSLIIKSNLWSIILSMVQALHCYLFLSNLLVLSIA